MERRLSKELLDQLPANDPRARRSRKDLRRVNAWMANATIMRGALRVAFADGLPRRLIDLGAGDGSFLLRLVHGLAPCWGGATVGLLDRHRLVSGRHARLFKSSGGSLRLFSPTCWTGCRIRPRSPMRP